MLTPVVAEPVHMLRSFVKGVFVGESTQKHMNRGQMVLFLELIF